MKKKGYSSEEIIRKLRQAEVLLHDGESGKGVRTILLTESLDFGSVLSCHGPCDLSVMS